MTSNHRDLPDDASQLLQAGRTARHEDAHELAHSLFCQSLRISREYDDKQGVAKALVELAYSIQDYAPESNPDIFEYRERHCQEALGLFREINNKKGIAYALWVLATARPEEEARRLLEESFAIARSANDPEGVIRALRCLSTRLSVAGNTDRAVLLMREALDLARDLEDKEAIATTLFQLGISFEGGKLEKQAILEEAQDMFRQLGRKGPLARSLEVCELLACDDEDLDQREVYLEEALTIREELGDAEMEAACLDRLAGIARVRGDTERADYLEARSREIAEPLQIPREFLEMVSRGDIDAVREAMREMMSRPAQPFTQEGIPEEPGEDHSE